MGESNVSQELKAAADSWPAAAPRLRAEADELDRAVNDYRMRRTPDNLEAVIDAWRRSTKFENIC